MTVSVTIQTAVSVSTPSTRRRMLGCRRVLSFLSAFLARGKRARRSCAEEWWEGARVESKTKTETGVESSYFVKFVSLSLESSEESTTASNAVISE